MVKSRVQRKPLEKFNDSFARPRPSHPRNWTTEKNLFHRSERITRFSSVYYIDTYIHVFLYRLARNHINRLTVTHLNKKLVLGIPWCVWTTRNINAYIYVHSIASLIPQGEEKRGVSVDSSFSLSGSRSFPRANLPLLVPRDLCNPRVREYLSCPFRSFLFF